MNKINKSFMAAVLLLSDSATLAASVQLPQEVTQQTIPAPFVKADGDTSFEALKTHFTLMDTKDWSYYGGGFLVGAVVESSTKIVYAGECWTQIVSVAEKSYLTYYHYDEYRMTDDVAHIIYASLYGAELAAVLNNSSCFQTELGVDDIIDVISDDGDQDQTNEQQQNNDGASTLDDILNGFQSDQTSADTLETIFEIANSQGEDSPLAEWLPLLAELFEITIDWDTTITQLEREKYINAGIFSGMGLSGLAFTVLDIYHQITGHVLIETTDSISREEREAAAEELQNANEESSSNSGSQIEGSGSTDLDTSNGSSSEGTEQETAVSDSEDGSSSGDFIEIIA